MQEKTERGVVRCPHDGAKCHHACSKRCYRKGNGMALTKPHKGFPLGVDHPVREKARA